MNNDLQTIYARRFQDHLKFKDEVFKVLCADCFQRYVPAGAVVVDIAAGYCEFINNIKAERKFAVDLNPDVSKYAAPEVEVVLSSSSDLSKISDGTADIVFVSNFFEHITKEEIGATLQEIHRILKKGGKLLVLQPNIRYCAKDYWMFFDHITPLDDRSLTEALEINQFRVVECRPRFLPYTVHNRALPRSTGLLKLYLRLPFLQNLVGQQAFLVAQK